ncbi:MAG: enoyl-CoA hydratase/isomerase family protein [Acidimicrobiales bacterium]|nr:enoyl-CoA hydratase/isomerase family protein [Acidimicrobiales bacterium]
MPGGRLNARVARDITETCEQLREDREPRVVVLRTAGSDFCTGPAHDLNPVAVSPDPAASLSTLRVPLVALISGSCVSVGLELVLACDIRIATSNSLFSLADAREGTLPMWGGTQRLPRAVSHGRASSMLLLGTEIDAATSRAWGLVHEIADDVDGALDRVVESLLASGPLALELAKEAIHRGSEMPLRDGLRLEGDLNHQLAATEDRAEGLAAFFAKRPPDFSGR